MNCQKLTVVIPTRERPDTLRKCLKTVINQDYSDLQIVVSDNFSGPETEAVVRSFNDPRIKYFNTGKRLSMSHNFEFAISKVDDGWIVVLGDDDGLLPNGLDRVVKLLRDSGTRALSSWTCYYRWPGRLDPAGSILSIPIRTGYETRNSLTYIKRLMNGFVGYPALPMLYTGGVVHASVLNEVIAKHGAFFKSFQPDIYSAIAVASVVESYVFSHEPFAIAGSSKHSTGAAYFSDEKPGIMNPAAQFFLEDNIPVNDKIPLTANGIVPVSTTVLVYESYLQSLCLHDDCAKVDPGQQLELILANASGKTLDEWGRDFAHRHGLDFDKVQSRSSRRRLLNRMAWLPKYYENFVDRYRIDASVGLKINDVYEASLVAATVLATRPGRAKSFVRTLWRRLPPVGRVVSYS